MAKSYGKNLIEERTAIIEQRPTGPFVRYTLPENASKEWLERRIAEVAQSGNPVVVQTFKAAR
jgi:hypothetical protein